MKGSRGFMVLTEAKTGAIITSDTRTSVNTLGQLMVPLTGVASFIVTGRD